MTIVENSPPAADYKDFGVTPEIFEELIGKVGLGR